MAENEATTREPSPVAEREATAPGPPPVAKVKVNAPVFVSKPVSMFKPKSMPESMPQPMYDPGGTPVNVSYQRALQNVIAPAHSTSDVTPPPCST